MFLINSRQGFFRCDPATAKHWPRKTPNERGTTRKKFIRILSATVCVKSAIFCGQCFALTGRALLLTYGRFFAEFLEEPSLVRLGLLDLTTCVGLRYGLTAVNLRSFSRKARLGNFLRRSGAFPLHRCLN